MLPDTATEINNTLDSEITPEISNTTTVLPEGINQELIQETQVTLLNIRSLAQELSQANDQFLTGIKKLLDEANKYSTEIDSYSKPKQ